MAGRQHFLDASVVHYEWNNAIPPRLEIDAGDSYTPFIRLALARFQRDSIENAHLSRIVLADFAQLAPDRVAAVLFNEDAPRRVTVMVTGVYGINQMTKGSNFNPGDSKTLSGLNSSRAIAVTVEERKSTELGELGWFPVAGQATDWLQPAEQFDAKMLWRGTVTLPLLSDLVEEWIATAR